MSQQQQPPAATSSNDNTISAPQSNNYCDTATYEQFENQQKNIENEIKKQPIIDPEASDLTLETLSYNRHDQSVQEKIEKSSLMKQYSKIRGIRGDGNCFLRGFVFKLLEYLIDQKNDDLTNSVISLIEQYYHALINELQYPEYCLEDFYESTKRVFEQVRDRSIVDVNTLIDNYFSDKTPDTMMESEAIICFFRFLLSCYIQLHSDDFLPFFLDQYATAKDFCSREIEIMGKDCDNIHINALSAAFGVKVRIEVLDAQTRSDVSIFGYTIPEDGSTTEPIIHLLFRPGHYEILYKTK